MKYPLMNIEELTHALEQLNDDIDEPWAIINNKLSKTYEFRNFIQAMGFMTQAALEAEKMNHHPEWSNVYKTVVVDLVTHSSGGITHLDFDLAGKMESLV
jgi:4a-hydroxytetrahydrobiopterin dehydratase